MKIRPHFAWVLGCCLSGWAAAPVDDGIWGEITTARRSNSEYFSPGLVNRGTFRGQPVYVICAATDKDFRDEKSTDLIHELDVESRQLLLDFLTQGQPGNFEIELSGMTRLYTWQEGALWLANYAIEIDRIKLNRKPTSPSRSLESGMAPTNEAMADFTKGSSSPQGLVQSPANSAPGIDPMKVRQEIEHLYQTGQYSAALTKTKLLSESEREGLESFIIKIQLHDAIDRQEDMPQNMLKLAEIYYGEQAYSSAAKIYEKVLEFKSELKSGDIERAWFRLAECKQFLNRHEEALHLYEQFCEAYPFSPQRTDALKRINAMQLERVRQRDR